MDIQAIIKLRFWIAVAAFLLFLENRLKRQRRMQYGPILVIVLEPQDMHRAFEPN